MVKKSQLSVKNTNETAVKNVSLENLIPEGYKLAEDCEATKLVELLGAGETATLTAIYIIADVPTTSATPSSPATGDSSNIMPALSLLFIAAICVLILAASKNKKGRTFLSLFVCAAMIGTTLTALPIQANAAEPERKTMTMETTIKVEHTELALKALVSYEMAAENYGAIKGAVANADDRTQVIPNAKIEVYDNETMSLIGTVYTDASGQYVIAVADGSYLIKISADGYIPFETLETVTNHQEIFVETYLMVPGGTSVDENGVIGGYITNSVTGVAIPEAKLTIRKGWNQTDGSALTSITTDENGYYQAELPLGNYTILMEKSNYITNHINVAVTSGSHFDKHGTMAPTEGSGIPTGELRIVLTWGEQPYDLDSHLRGTFADETWPFHIFFSQKSYIHDGLEQASLDIDDTTSYGPETITIYNMNPSGTYSYYVHDYTNKSAIDSTALASSNAQVRVYIGNELIATYHVPASGVGNVWHVFDFDAQTRRIIPVNSFSTQTSAGSVGSNTTAPVQAADPEAREEETSENEEPSTTASEEDTMLPGGDESETVATSEEENGNRNEEESTQFGAA